MSLSRETVWDMISLPSQADNEETAKLMRDLPASYGGTLAMLMERRGYTQAEFAERIRCSEKTIQRMKNDESYIPSLKMVLTVCVGLQPLALALCLDIIDKSQVPQRKTVNTVAGFGRALLEVALRTDAAEVEGWYNDALEAFIVGDGANKPTGILADTGGAQLGVTTATAATLKLDEVIDLFYSLKAPYRRNASFLLNDSTVKEIRKLKDNNGNYLWQPSIKEATPDTILNRPLYTSAYMPGIAAGAKTMLFGDFSYYWVADRQGRMFRRLNELYAVNGQVGFIATQRVDGKLILPEAVKYLTQKA